jgi:hypothetical protein
MLGCKGTRPFELFTGLNNKRNHDIQSQFITIVSYIVGLYLMYMF